MIPTLPEYLALRWGNNWAICRDSTSNREKHGLCITQEEYDRTTAEYQIKFGMIELPPWSHAVVLDALRGVLHGTCGIDGEGRPMRLHQFMPREVSALAGLLARLRIAP